MQYNKLYRICKIFIIKLYFMKNIDCYNLSNDFTTIEKFQDIAEKYEMTDEKKKSIPL